MIKQYIVHNIVRFIIGFVFGVGLYILNLSLKNGWGVLAAHVDGLFIGGGVVFLFGLLSILANFGSFNTFSYIAGRKRLESGRKEDLYEYTKRKKLERQSNKYAFVAYFVMSAPFLISGLVLYLILIH